MSKAVDDILGFLRTEFLSAEDQAELIQRLRDGEADEHKPAGVWTMTDHTGALSIAENPRANVAWVHGPDVDPDDGLTVTFYHGQMDGKPVIQIDGDADFRINVNECPVWDQSTEVDYEVPDELRESLERNRRIRAVANAVVEARRKVWVGTISDADGVWVYVGASEQALYADMRSNYGRVEFREESDHDWVKRAGNAGAIVNTDSYYVEGED